MFCTARPLMLSPKGKRKAHSDRRWSSPHHQPHHPESTRLTQPMMQPDDIRGSAQNLMGMVWYYRSTISLVLEHIAFGKYTGPHKHHLLR